MACPFGTMLSCEWTTTKKRGIQRTNEVQVIEPKLTTTKHVHVGNPEGNPGDPVTYTIVIKQDAASSTDAFAATLTDIIPSEIASPVLTSVVDTEAGQVTTGNFLLSGNVLDDNNRF